MPQMAPYNWLIMFMMFNIMLTFYSCYNNFTKIPTLKNNKIHFNNLYKWLW